MDAQVDNCIFAGSKEAQGSLEQLHTNTIFGVYATIERPGHFVVAQNWNKGSNSV